MAVDGGGSGGAAGGQGNELLRQAYRRAARAALLAEERGEGDLATLVVPALDEAELTARCIETIARCTKRPYELILVDNGSGEAARKAFEALAAADSRITLVRNERNEGFAFAANQGLERARGRHVVVLNNDVLVTPGWLSRLAALAELDERIGMTGPRTNRCSGPQALSNVPYDAERADPAAIDAFATELAQSQAGQVALVPRLVGLCLLIKRSVLQEIGGFDTCFGYGNFEDDDLGLRALRRGYRLAIASDAFVHHHGSRTFRAQRFDYRALMQRNWSHFCHKWEHDAPLGPYPALSLARARPFVRARDHVPVSHAAVFRPDAEPWPLDDARGTRLLAILEPDDASEAGHRALDRLLDAYAQAFGPDDDVSLVLRADPPNRATLDAAAHAYAALAKRSGRSPEQLPDIVLEASALPPARRGGLYTACSALLVPSKEAHLFHQRDARACGLAVHVVADGEGLRGLVATPPSAAGRRARSITLP